MRLAIIRQRYTPYGGAERFVESALEALLERGIAITLYTRRWPQTPAAAHRAGASCNPFYIGRLWRDWSFARAVCARDRHASRRNWCSRTSGCCAATSTAPATACTGLARRAPA